MTPRVALFATLSLSSACATRLPPSPEIAPAREACDPRLTAPLETEPPVTGSIVQPATEAERAAVDAFLSSEAQARAWGREGWARAASARAACERVGAGLSRDSAASPARGERATTLTN